MTILILGTIGKSSLEREHRFLTEFALVINSCFIKRNAPIEEKVNAAQQMNPFCEG